MRTALYRHFDAGGQLLYVGISLSAVARLAQHKQTARWFAAISRVDVEWLASREAALAAEAVAIAGENPKFNLQRPRAPAASAPRQQPGRALVIVHPASGRRDGNYFRASDAHEMLHFWQTEFPREQFLLELVEGMRPARPALRPHESDLWRSVA